MMAAISLSVPCSCAWGGTGGRLRSGVVLVVVVVVVVVLVVVVVICPLDSGGGSPGKVSFLGKVLDVEIQARKQSVV